MRNVCETCTSLLLLLSSPRSFALMCLPRQRVRHTSIRSRLAFYFDGRTGRNPPPSRPEYPPGRIFVSTDFAEPSSSRPRSISPSPRRFAIDSNSRSFAPPSIYVSHSLGKRPHPTLPLVDDPPINIHHCGRDTVDVPQTAVSLSLSPPSFSFPLPLPLPLNRGVFPLLYYSELLMHLSSSGQRAINCRRIDFRTQRLTV